MKTITRFSLLVTAASVLVLSNLGISAVATEKGAELLIKRNTPQAINTTKTSAMNCASCTDSLVTVVDYGTKGPRHAVNSIVRHNCASCDTRIVTKGFGKTASNVAVHTCGAGSAAMCASH